MLKVTGREIVNLSEDEVWAQYHHPRMDVAVECDDGTIQETTARAVILTWYGFAMHRAFPRLPVKRDHIIPGGKFNDRVQSRVTSALEWDTWDAIDGAMEPGEIALHVQMVNNDWYNAYVSRMSEYLPTLNILDMVEICSDERAEEAMANAKPNEDSIAEVYRVHLEVMKDEQMRYPNNNLVKAYNAGILKKGQLLQNISIRGFVTDGDSNIFPNPIMSGFCRGMDNLRDVVTERCSAVKALLMADGPLAATEYLNRRIQLIANVVTNLLRGTGTSLYSCSDYKTIPFTVSESNRKNLEGSYWVDSVGVEHSFDRYDNELIGRTINLRNPLGCGHRHEGRVCGKCMGDISWSLEARDNLGQQASMELCPRTSQSVMSTKHLDTSSTSALISFPPAYEDTLKPSQSGMGARFTNRVTKGGVLIIPWASLPHPNDINIVENIRSINPVYFSKLSKIAINFDHADKRWSDTYNVSIDGVDAYFTADMLDYIKKVGLRTDDKGNYLLDLSEWDYNKTVFSYPKRHRNMIDFMNTMSCMYESTGDFPKGKLSYYKTESEGLQVFSDLIFETFDVNIAHLSVLLLATLARDTLRGDHSIPTIHEPFEFGSMRDNIMNRSITGKLAYQSQVQLLVSTAAYNNKRRPMLPSDWIIAKR